MKPIRVVAPFLPLEPEAPHHLRLAAESFDWPGAIAMLADSVTKTLGCPFHVITDVAADITAAPTLRYSTLERRLMLWNLEVAACYLESGHFDRDTVMLDSDQLIVGDLRSWFQQPRMDLGILIRQRPKAAQGIPILNGVQFLAHRGKPRLAAFYRQALEVARTLPESQIRWGADTEALRELLEPLDVGLQERAGLMVSLIDYAKVLEALSSQQMARMDAGEPMVALTRPVLDFRYMRKRYMRRVHDELFVGAGAVA